MPFFGEQQSPFDELVVKATNATNDSENWGIILGICDCINDAKSSTKTYKDCLLSVRKRLNNRDAHVVMHALSLLDALMNNCSSAFRREVCTREFIAELKSKATCSTPAIAERTRQMIKKWCDMPECKNDSSLHLLTVLFKELKQDGFTFEDVASKAKSAAQSKHLNDPNYVASQEEADAIAKAIAESLAVSNVGSAHKSTPSSAYPMAAVSAAPAAAARTANRVVRALYDFEAAEDNEITFHTDELLTITDDSDANWWRGTNPRGQTGLFPASFVTTEVDPAPTSKRQVQFNDDVKTVEIEKAPVHEPATIDEHVLDECLRLLQAADSTGLVPDSDELLSLEKRSHEQTSLIDAQLAVIDRRHNVLADVDMKLRDALALYDVAMQQSINAAGGLPPS